MAALSVSAVVAHAGQPGSHENQPGASPAGAVSPKAVRDVSHWNIEKDSHLAISGYDPVAYFPEGGGKPAKGDPKITAQYNGAVYQFTSAANRDRFLANPARYEPAHGGWCSWAMREGDKVEVDPRSFIVKGGRLFLFYNGLLADTRSKWLKGDFAAEAREADEHWKKLSGEDPRDVSIDAPRPAAPVSLNAKLDEVWQGYAAKMPAEAREKYDQNLRQIEASGVTSTALKVGAKAPDFELPDAKGNPVKLSSMLEKGPVVLTWYRGGWCPFCNIQLREYQDHLDEMKSMGATLVAVSPQTPDNSLSTAEKDKLTFPVLSDKGNTAARQYGLVYKAPGGAGKMLAQANGDDSGELPIAATYVLDRTGTIVYAYTSANYRTRAETTEIMDALRKLK